MPVDLQVSIREKLANYLAGKISLSAFRSWFDPILWDVDETDENARQLAYGIELLLSEFDHGDWTVEELKERLRPFVAFLAI
ncbi:MAG: hypothetical protein ACJ8FY_22570 [Gemmataceae bacterium]